MTLLQLLMSCTLGAISGVLYGLSFVFTQRRVLYSQQTPDHNSYRKQIPHSLISAARIVIFAIIVYLLRLETIHFILVVTTFLLTFWLLVLTRKIYCDERLWSLTRNTLEAAGTLWVYTPILFYQCRNCCLHLDHCNAITYSCCPYTLVTEKKWKGCIHYLLISQLF